ncbi:MAG TPA: hypothetical protein VLQ89_09075 [Candidatus Binatia bacterium]|nr:hypothetical protein [Candidatus Binatia bacterium]
MKRLLLITLLLLLHVPQSSKAPVYAQNDLEPKFPGTATIERPGSFANGEDDIFSTTYERELLSRRIFKKSLPALSRKEKIGWSFKTAKSNTFL